MSIPVDSMSRIKDPVSEAMEQLASPTHPVHTLPHPPVDPGSTPTPNPYIIVAVREQARLIAQMRNGVPIAQLENPFTMSDAEYLHFIQTRLLQDPPDMSRYRYDRDVDIVRAMLIAPDENANLDPDTGSSSASAILPSTSDRSLGGSIWATQTAQESKTGKEKAELQPRSPARHQRRQVPLPPSPPLSLNDEQRNKTIRDILVRPHRLCTRLLGTDTCLLVPLCTGQPGLPRRRGHRHAPLTEPRRHLLRPPSLARQVRASARTAPRPFLRASHAAHLSTRRLRMPH